MMRLFTLDIEEYMENVESVAQQVIEGLTCIERVRVMYSAEFVHSVNKRIEKLAEKESNRLRDGLVSICTLYMNYTMSFVSRVRQL